jgi:hypothetical protein
MHVMGDIELLTRKVETSHWKKEEISLHDRYFYGYKTTFFNF